ncbi:TetR/AcrR family transcriptional regulator [Gemmobacter serpentinus]|uniref:TetR/AcrR family transcriptional regulator n=1 Tax=Gemmobacter serpentinus TaxID=2652247 RepID=UPI00124C2C57|nr:TetR/AcrR family transcriptional regulator [Gemmobacter serpentinus]
MTQISRREQNRIEREHRILEAAMTVFAQSGYSGAGMDAIAAEAGITKPTLYQYFESKEALFSAMMRGFRNEMLDVFQHPSDEGMVQDLYLFAWDYADTVMRPDMLALARLIIGEVGRFPEIGRYYQEAGPDRLLQGIMTYLDSCRAAGRLEFQDAELAAEDLWGLILSAPRTHALYKPDLVPPRADLARFIHNGLRVFLRAYSTRPADDLTQLEKLTRLPPPASTGDA